MRPEWKLISIYDYYAMEYDLGQDECDILNEVMTKQGSCKRYEPVETEPEEFKFKLSKSAVLVQPEAIKPVCWDITPMELRYDED